MQCGFLPCQGRRLSKAEAAWILGFYLHHNVEGHFVPGSLGQLGELPKSLGFWMA